jgi:sugar lactone lactonase YvrE
LASFADPCIFPFGINFNSTDADGFVWVALSGSSRVVRINPMNGCIDMTVRLPVSSPTSLTFGGPMLDELFITTRGPDGGALYRVKLPYGIHGLAEAEYRIIVENATGTTVHNN